MFKRYRELAAEIGRLMRKNPVVRDAEGRVEVAVTLNEKSGLFAPYAVAETTLLSSELSELLKSITFALRTNEQIHLIFKNCPDPSEQEKLRQAIRATFITNFTANRIRARRNLIASILLLLVSVAFLSVMAVLSLNGVSSLLVELVDIAGWVFMWEAVDEFFIERSVLRIKKRRYLNLITAQVDFAEAN